MTTSKSLKKDQILPAQLTGKYGLFHGDVKAETPEGWPKFHAVICDTPYHLTTVERFGKAGSVPANTPLGRRMSGGFLHEEWDGGELVSFQKETWEAIAGRLYDGALILACGHMRTYDRLKAAMREAGLIIYPDLICWAYGSGMSLPSRVNRFVDPEIEETWGGYYYGLDVLKPALEPWVIAQKPWPGRPMDSIAQTGAGIMDLDGASHTGKDGKIRRPNTLTYTHSPFCTEDTCADDCPSRMLPEGKDDYFFGAYWHYDLIEQVRAAPPILYFPKPTDLEREAGTEHLPAMGKQRLNPGGMSNDERWQDIEDTANGHPTAKPIALTKYLAQLILPPEFIGQRNLYVPFGGVASEMIGGILAGWDSVYGQEITEKYVPVGNARIEYWHRQKELGFTDPATILKNYRLSRDEIQQYMFA